MSDAAYIDALEQRIEAADKKVEKLESALERWRISNFELESELSRIRAGQEPVMTAGGPVPKAVFDERVACAKVCDDFGYAEGPGERRYSGNVCSARILERSMTPYSNVADLAERIADKNKQIYSYGIETWEYRSSAARRYERLRILGCAPDGSPQLEKGTVLRFQSLDDFIDADINRYPSRGEAEHHQPAAPKPYAWVIGGTDGECNNQDGWIPAKAWQEGEFSTPVFLHPAAPRVPECTWTLADDDSSMWETTCGNAFTFIDGGPTENDMKFCPYCGGKLAAAPQPSEKEE